jgi:hypothetical protein
MIKGFQIINEKFCPFLKFSPSSLDYEPESGFLMDETVLYG